MVKMLGFHAGYRGSNPGHCTGAAVGGGGCSIFYQRNNASGWNRSDQSLYNQRWFIPQKWGQTDNRHNLHVVDPYKRIELSSEFYFYTWDQHEKCMRGRASVHVSTLGSILLLTQEYVNITCVHYMTNLISMGREERTGALWTCVSWTWTGCVSTMYYLYTNVIRPQFIIIHYINTPKITYFLFITPPIKHTVQ